MKNVSTLNRTLYTLKVSLVHRKRLRQFLQPIGRCAQVTALTPERLETMGVTVLVLDFDGVLSPYAAVEPVPHIQKWLHHLINTWSGQLFILSNKPFSEREAFMKQAFPSIQFVSGVAKKPFPEGLEKIIALSKTPPDHLLMVDDRLLTGILAACIVGAQALLITHPLRQIPGKKALHEFFFSFLRLLDTLWVMFIA